MNYTDLILDLYGTLVDIHTEETDTVWEKTALYLSFHGARYDGPELKRAFRAAAAAQEAAAGKGGGRFPDIPFEQVMAQLLRAKGVERNADAMGVQGAQLWRILSIDYLQLYPHVPQALAVLREKGFRLWLLSNAQRVFTAYELRHLGLESAFDGVYLSTDYGCRKPDARFFRILLRERRLDPEKCLMVGNDRCTDIAGAGAVGLATVYLHTNLTPPGQSPADPALRPGAAPAGCRHFEYEGSDWAALVPLLCGLL